MNALNRALLKIDKAILRVEDIVCCVLVLAMACIIFIQILCRFGRFPLVWSEELSRFMFVWLIYISTGCVVHREKHLCVDILPLMLPPKGKIVLKIIANFLSMLFFLFVAYYGVGVIQKMIARPQVSAAMHLNMIWAYSGPYVGAAISCIHYVILIVQEITELITSKNPREVED